jgi:hypothetical protein
MKVWLIMTNKAHYRKYKEISEYFNIKMEYENIKNRFGFTQGYFSEIISIKDFENG